MGEFKNLLEEFPKIMEEVLSENNEKNEEWLSKILIEQEILQKVGKLTLYYNYMFLSINEFNFFCFFC